MSAESIRSTSDSHREHLSRLEIKSRRNEISFRDAFWYNFKGNSYRNKGEFELALRNFELSRDHFVLELGAGSGRITGQFSKRGADIVALDLSKQSLKYNKKHSRCQCVQADLCYLPFKDSSFDRVAAMSVFQSVPKAERRAVGLCEVRRVLKHKGEFLIEVFNYRFFDRLRGTKEGYFATSPVLYYYRFGKDELKKALSCSFALKDLSAILLFHPLMRRYRIGNSQNIVKLLFALESKIVKTSLAFWLSDFLVAFCQKT